jgi:hypothetical protein
MVMLRRDAARLALEASTRAKYGPKRPEPWRTGRVLSLGYLCWCGEPVGHGWPGKADGQAHPR